MPRKKPDLTPWTDGETAVDSVFAKMVKYNRYGYNYILRVKDNPATQRTVKCQECGLVIPRDVPRIAREGSWYRKGHMCMSCGGKEAKGYMEEMQTLREEIDENIALSHALAGCAEQIEVDKRYEDKLAMGKMLQVIGGKRLRQ